MAKECWLTTKDNPYDPFKEPEKWRRYDCVDNDYCTNAYIARIALLSESMTEAEEAAEIERAVNEIIKYDFLDIYRKVVRETPIAV